MTIEIEEGSRGAFYARYSTVEQNEDLQRNSVNEFVAGYKAEIVKEYIDEAKSATRVDLEKREKFNELFEDAKKDKFDFIVVYAKDRLARDVFDHAKIKRMVKKIGKKIFIANEQEIYGEKKTIVEELVSDAITQWEANNIRRRVTDGKTTKAKDGKWNGGTVPFGYDYDHNTKLFTQKTSEAILVKQIFELYIEGYSCEKIAEKLPKGSYEKAETRGNKSKDWTRSRVQNIVTNPFYAGIVTWGKRRRITNRTLEDRPKWIEKTSKIMDPIISKETWEKAWNLYRKKGDAVWPRRSLSSSYLLSGVIFCPHCKTPLKADNQITEDKVKEIKYGGKFYSCEKRECKEKLKTENKEKYKRQKDDVEFKVMNMIRVHLLSEYSNLFKNIENAYKEDISKEKKLIESLDAQFDQINNRIRLVSKKIESVIYDY